MKLYVLKFENNYNLFGVGIFSENFGGFMEKCFGYSDVRCARTCSIYGRAKDFKRRRLGCCQGIFARQKVDLDKSRSIGLRKHDHIWKSHFGGIYKLRSQAWRRVEFAKCQRYCISLYK